MQNVRGIYQIQYMKCGVVIYFPHFSLCTLIFIFMLPKYLTQEFFMAGIFCVLFVDKYLMRFLLIFVSLGKFSDKIIKFATSIIEIVDVNACLYTLAEKSP